MSGGWLSSRDYWGARGQGRAERRRQGHYGPLPKPQAKVVPAKFPSPAAAAAEHSQQPRDLPKELESTGASAKPAPKPPVRAPVAKTSSPAGSAGKPVPSPVAEAAGEPSPSTWSVPPAAAPVAKTSSPAGSAGKPEPAASTSAVPPAVPSPVAEAAGEPSPSTWSVPPAAVPAQPSPPTSADTSAVASDQARSLPSESWPFDHLMNVMGQAVDTVQLPYGWRQVRLTSEQTYYFNEDARICSWQQPVIWEVSPAEATPPEMGPWSLWHVWGTAKRVKFFYNTSSGQSASYEKF
ncbi:unnamed protein product, partial [Symbiodinium sp. CCMP2592]